MENINNNEPAKINTRTRVIAAVIIAILALAGYGFWRHQQSFAVQISAKRIDKQVSLKNVTVKPVSNTDMVFFVSDGKHQALVYLNFDLQSKTHLANNSQILRDGQKVDVTGALKAAPQADYMKSIWKMEDSAAQTVSSQGLYIEADKLNIIK